VASTAAGLSARVPASVAIISNAHEAYRGARLHGQSPHGDIAARLREGVMTLPAYATAAEPPSGEVPRRGKRALEV
jgi:hypothetical protein